MSVSLWRYTEACEGDFCCGDCDLCDKKTDLDEETIEESNKLTKEQWENLWDSGYLGGVI